MTAPSSPTVPPSSTPDQPTRLEPGYLLGQLRSDSARLAEVARMGTGAVVPACPGWTVADLVEHVAAVYLHKVVAMRTNAQPDPWPPDFTGRDPLELFDEARGELLAELERRGPDAPAWTFWPDDPTSGFWLRRMAHESAVHRVDAEQAHGVLTPLDRALSLDGIDEVLKVMLGGPWWDDDDTEEPVDATVRVTSGGRSWTARIERLRVTVTDGAQGEAAAELFGEPGDLLLWLWGRRGDEVVEAAGDADVVHRFHNRLAETLT